MIVGSICSGIEAASTAWHPLGWTTAYVSEIEPFPCAVLAQRLGAGEPRFLPEGFDRKRFRGTEWGNVIPNYGDFTQLIDLVESGEAPAVDGLVGGTPCQAFSVAGNRQSLGDARGNLTLQFVRLIHAHARRTDKPLRWAAWENVPGVLSTEDNAFGCFLAGLVGGDDPLHVPGGGRWPDSGMVAGPLGRAAWRVLDAQHFGVAQRRARVFLVFSPRGSDIDPAAVLFERKGVRGDHPAGGEAGEGIAGGVDAGLDGGLCAPIAPSLTSSGRGVPRPGETRGQDPVVAVDREAFGGGNRSGAIDVAACHEAGGNKQDFEVETFVAHTLRADGFDASEDGTGRGTPLVPCAPAHAFDARQSDVCQYGDLSGPLDTDGFTVGVLAPQQCEHAPICGNCDRDLIECRGDPCTMTYPVCRICTADLPAIAFALRGREGGAQPEVQGDHVGALRAGGGGSSNSYVAASAVRRLTPRECERLQAFPDDHTRIRIRHFKDRKITKNRPADMWEPDANGGWWLMAADGPRYKALGNSKAVTVVSWVGQRIQACADGTLEGWRFDWSLVPWVSLVAGQQGAVIPILEAGARTGKSTTDIRAGMGVGSAGDPMFTLQAGKQHGVAQ